VVVIANVASSSERIRAEDGRRSNEAPGSRRRPEAADVCFYGRATRITRFNKYIPHALQPMSIAK